MIRTFKPPPRVNPHAAVHGREEDDYYKDGHTANPKVDNIIEFDFEAAVAEEMRKLEEDFRQKAPAAYVAADFVDRNPPKDLFEAPYHESEAPYKISITNDARAGLFESHVNAAVSELGQNIASPGRRKGRAISNLHGDQDNRLNLKAAKAAEYANYLQNQINEKEEAKRREKLQQLAPSEAFADHHRHDQPARWKKAEHEYGNSPRGNEMRQPPAQPVLSPQESNHRDYTPAAEPVHQERPLLQPVEGYDDSLDRLRRLRNLSEQAPGGYAPSGWSKQPLPSGYDPEHFKMENLNLPNSRFPIPGTPNNHNLVHPVPAPSRRNQHAPPPKDDFLSHASKRETYISPQSHTPIDNASPNGGGVVIDEKMLQKQKQMEYRLQLERQMEEQKQNKKNMEKYWEGEELDEASSDKLKREGLKHYNRRRDPNTENEQSPLKPQRSNHHGDNNRHQPPPNGHLQGELLGSPSSPGKVSSARSRMIKDVYGHGGVEPGEAGGGDRDDWKPSLGAGGNKRGMAANDYKAALDLQMLENERRKEELKLQKKKEEEEEQLRMLAYQRRVDAEKQAELNKKKALEAQAEADIHDREEARVQELLAKKKGHRGKRQDEGDSYDDPPMSNGSRAHGLNEKFSPPSGHALDAVLESSEGRASMDSALSTPSRQLDGPKTPPRYSRVSLGDGVKAQSKNSNNNYNNLRKLEDKVLIEERGATPGGSLACNSFLVPVRDSSSGTGAVNMSRVSGAFMARQSSQWRDQPRNVSYHQPHPNAYFRPDIPKYNPLEDVEDDAVVVAWQEGLNRRARQENFMISPRLIQQSRSPNSYGSKRNARSADRDNILSPHGEDDPWGPHGLLSALGDRGSGPSAGPPPITINRRPEKAQISQNVNEQSLASESFLTYIDNRRPMTAISDESSNKSVAHDAKRPSSIVEAPGSPLGNMLRHDAAVAGQRARRPKEQQKPTQDYNYQPAYYDDPAPPNNVEYDSLNYLLRNSEERASRDLFQVAAQRGPQYRPGAPVKHVNRHSAGGYQEEYNDDQYRYSDDESELVIMK